MKKPKKTIRNPYMISAKKRKGGKHKSKKDKERNKKIIILDEDSY